MAKVIVFHYTDEGRLPPPGSHTFNGTFADDSGRGFCEWDAPSAEAVHDILEIVLGTPPADGTAVVKQVL